MPRAQLEAARTDRIELRASPAEKALLLRAAAMERLDLTTFVMRSALPKAETVVAATEIVQLSERDSMKVLELLEHPPEPTLRLIEVARRRLGRK